ncbi:uncharacterized protein Z520_07314 [Fonsecaea multimorphosa CBS 102226]|uniref:Ribosomal protein L28 n=1 Tax=Fonsecaea multimorphosa CBS 102226 TaxID=1442371 RepID=A0A0D2H5R8_9EURO|nr:uncharacterized protein Z520_07314 [Fonsecaea multimorphosa CBS 102226]KIX97200.1 hypothetical protein Z520_07314 [Fonsecaea multimorphosa CBS 102226]OAL22975.1 hypothetical protein AYO22_06883 [Fonsecaea multimorphosa]
MAAPTTITKLPEVLRSPTTLQYFSYRHPVKHSNPYFKPRFTFKVEDRNHTMLDIYRLRHTDPLMPPYPYGENKHFPEANFGLYGGATVQSGSKISKGRNKGKSLRHWFPNVRIETVRSEALNRDLKIPITARVMRTISKCGGIDQYVTGMKPARIKELGMLGWKLRWLVMTSPKYRAEHAKQLKKYNLPTHYSLSGSFEDAWNDENVRAKMIEQQEAAWSDLREAADRFEKHVKRNWIESGEKETYEIPKLETLNRSSPLSMGLPEYLEEPDIVEEKYRHVRTFRKSVRDDVQEVSTELTPFDADSMVAGGDPKVVAMAIEGNNSGDVESHAQEITAKTESQDLEGKSLEDYIPPNGLHNNAARKETAIPEPQQSKTNSEHER